MPYTVDDVLGFSNSLAVNSNVNVFMQKFDEAAKSRGIKITHEPSDALDMSRNICLDEAAQALGLTWEIRDHTLLLGPVGWTIDWDQIIADNS